MELSKPRFRIGAKQTAKNYWYFDGTVEFGSTKLTFSSDPKDVAKLTEEPLGKKLLDMIKETEEQFRQDGRKVISDIS